MAQGGRAGQEGVRVPVYVDTSRVAGQMQQLQQVMQRQAERTAIQSGQATYAGATDPTTGRAIQPRIAQRFGPAITTPTITPEQAQAARTGRDIDRLILTEKKDRENQIKQRRQAFAQKVMGYGVPTAIGLGGMAALGPALNIGFASMSGGPVGGGVAASSFIVGGTVRALIRVNTALSKFQDSLVKTAEGMNFVTDSFKEQRATSQAIKVFQGGIALSTREKTMEKWNKALLDNIDIITKLNMNYQVMRSMVSELTLSFAMTGVSLLGGPDRATKGIIKAIASLPGRFLGSSSVRGIGELGGGLFAAEAISRSRELRPYALASVSEQIRNLQEGMFTPAFTSPEQFFKKTQLRLLKPDIAKEQRMYMIKVLEQQRDSLKELVASEKGIVPGGKLEVWEGLLKILIPTGLPTLLR